MMFIWLFLIVPFTLAQYDGGTNYMNPRYGGHGQYNSYTKTGGTKTHSFTKTGHTKTKTFTKTHTKNLSTANLKGGCMAEPPKPMNAAMRCSQYSGCRVDCMDNYQFPNGQKQLFLLCEDDRWRIKDNLFETLPACEPICLPACQNNGICVSPNQCNCPENFSGPECQYENKPCLNYPPMPLNSKRSCRSTSCTISCMPGHQFPDGTSITTMICKNGFWQPSKEIWKSVPDCEATCEPPCQNGGNCLSFNVCQCPQNYRGPQCQYSADECNPKKLQINGGYNCSGDTNTFSCSINCPEGIEFEFQPEIIYTCSYDQGIYLPAPRPQCVYPVNSQIIPLGGSSHSFYKIMNNSAFDLSSISINGQINGGDSSGVLDTYPSNLFGPNSSFNNSKFEFIPIKTFEGNKDNQMVIVEQKLPEPGVCFTWNGRHFKTFDGKVFSFNSKCPYLLLRDAVDNTFSVTIENNKECSQNPTNCYRILHIYLQDKLYTLKKSPLGIPIFSTAKKILPIPGQVSGIRIELLAHYVVVSLDSIGAKIRWDGQQLVQVEVKENLWNRTEGLCGNLDGDSTNDFRSNGHDYKTVGSFAKNWQMSTIDNPCDEMLQDQSACPNDGIKGSKSDKAFKFCKTLLSDARFSSCHKTSDIKLLLDACRDDYCACPQSDPKACACETLNVYVKSCAHKGIKTLTHWRDENTCPMKCEGNKIYRPCAPPKGQPTCGASTERIDDVTDECIEGCYCPEGTVSHENNCIPKEKCPCRLRGKDFPPGAQVPKECNTCTCQNGQWKCTEVSCGARCATIGDPHYTTFDGKKFDFMGQCSYYLVKNDNFSIEAENVACAGAISLAMNFPTSVGGGLPSCTKTVTIRISGQTVKLKQNHDLVVNGQDISKLPYNVADVKIRTVSSIFTQVLLPNGVEVWWDGVTRVYIDVPPTLRDQTKGLCGTFNHNQKDDFLTPENDVENSVVPFANKWKTAEKCNDIPDHIKSHPCTLNIQNKPTAETQCTKIKSNLFSDCHPIVDPEPYYQDCLYDVCSCEYKLSKCLCPIVAAYAEECTRKGIKINWREDIRECGIHCPGGQKYQVCGNSCTRTCTDISFEPECQPQCVEGCNCPEGQALDDNGDCIPIGQCKCRYEGLEFNPLYKEVRPASKGEELCVCVNAIWECHPATPEEIQQYPKASDLKSSCGIGENKEFTTCEPVEPVTCKNMHSEDYFTAAICHPGCKCVDGYVLDTTTKKCVKPEQCPCHHGGKSYSENATVQNDCNTCQCQNGKWECTTRQCSAECSAWGDSHYKTFDDKQFDYQGQCDYVLTKGSSAAANFDITTQNVPCGSLGTTCSKSVTIRVIAGGEPDLITLTRDKILPLYATTKHLTIRQKGLFVIVEAPDLGVSLQWDKGTRVYIKVDPRWKGKLKGLCGNYNDDDSDDFQTPSGGLTEVSPKLFGDSWKLQSYCPEALEITDTCEDRPDRKVWALKKCGILKSHLFAPCHSEVPVDSYLEKCVFDSCACDQGGDCECLCTAIAAYAQECNSKGAPIRWRSQELCPMQCDERCTTYSPCISTCPTETCDNILTESQLGKACNEDTCIEGCAPKPCPPGHIYLNSTLLECVPRNICKPLCMEINGVQYYEGDLVEEDACHSCYCSRGKSICKGEPCPGTTLRPTTLQHEQISKCVSGWTEWINQDKITHKKTHHKKHDKEPLPDTLVMNHLKTGGKCTKDKIIDIECRTVKTHLHPKQTGLDVECSLETGLICNGKGQKCDDFEIRVLCHCDEPTSITTPSPTACDVSKPHIEHPDDCHLFYHCVPDINGTKLVEKTCGPTMLFNPKTMICDWPYTVQQIKPECQKSSKCPPGTIEDECAIECERMCMFYSFMVKQSGKCANGATCEHGCVSAEKKISCPPGLMFANNETCVALHDCLCRSHDGKPVKPGTVFRESECEVCQCIDNFYTCDKSACNEELESTGHEVLTTTEKIVTIIKIIKNTVTPPKKCDENNFINLIQGDEPLDDDAFSASSVLVSGFEPQNARITNSTNQKPDSSWVPQYSNLDQYLDINLGREEPVYGIIVQGNALYNEYVTSYKLLHSNDGENFYPVLNDENHPQIFRGSIDRLTPVKQIFDKPFEAKIVRINPQTWHHGIGLKVELLGCAKIPTTTPIPKPKPIQCDDSMGLDEGMLSDQQVSVSSELKPELSKKHLKLNSDNAWQPLTNSPSEFVIFDFLEPRNVTGFETKGGPNGWVKSFNVEYSHDGLSWNPIYETENKENKLFLGNFDSNTAHKNEFDLPISTQLVKIIPKKWHKNIQLRAEVKGCFKPYPELTTVPTTTPIPTACNLCPDVPTQNLELNACHCKEDKWWDGENCIARSECPCFVGHIPYPVGTVFEKENCMECLCKLGGVTYCTPKKCGKCEPGLRSKVTTTCECTCEPCPENTTLCPTSNICINSKLWCDGIQDCPDDEVGCTPPPPPPTEPSTTTEAVKVCPKITCPPQYVKKEKKPSRVKNFKTYISPMFSNYEKKTTKTASQYNAKTYTKSQQKKKIIHPTRTKPKEVKEEMVCPEYVCTSSKRPNKFIHDESECPPAICPPNYIPTVSDDQDDDSDWTTKTCPRYICYPPPPPDAVCNVTGRTFNTFDNVEYKYDICNHILARDLQNDEWEVSLKKSCQEKICIKNLIIRHESNILVLFPDLSVEFNGFKYTVGQTKKIASKMRAFSIIRLGNTLFFTSNRYGFWIIWSMDGNIKFGVVHKLENQVDGLCGYFNGNPEDDKSKPDGTIARTTVEFGDSWALPAGKEECEIKTCPKHIQDKAWEMCNSAKNKVLSPCAKVLDIEAFISRCLETNCECLEAAGKNHTAQEECRCTTLQNFVVDCLMAEPETDLTEWRTQLDCPITCDNPLVYHDCYQRQCEPTCESISDPNICPKLPNVCFPGCYCPPGHVKKGDTCIKPSSCRDCECNLLPHLQYITYDHNNFTIDGNCVYVMSRDTATGGDEHKFQVLVTNGPCPNSKEKSCVGKITILYADHKIHVVLDSLRHKLRLLVDGEMIRNYDTLTQWLKVRETATKHLKILLTDLQVEISVYYPSLGVSVKAPSHKYRGKLEGLCGDCNRLASDDLRKPNGELTDNIDELAISWLYDKLPGGQNAEQCHNKPQQDCVVLPPDQDPCLQILDVNKFGQCLQIVDPTLFVEWCKKDTCNNQTNLACAAIEAYARDCANAGFCINWRNEFCPATTCSDEKTYDPCGTSCPKTCESIKNPSQKTCTTIPVEGCFCPEGKVLLNDTCVYEKDCEVCDDEGHHPGDTWKKDKCTTCECDGTTLKCHTQYCPDLNSVCNTGFIAIKIPTNKEECCDKYICQPEPTAGPTCETPQKLICGEDQVTKLDTKPNGCQQFICQCKPTDQCQPIVKSPNGTLQDGYTEEVDENGCCPKLIRICKKELCPKAPECPQYHTLTQEETDCCSKYDCKAPEDKCIYEEEYTADKIGGERPRTKFEKLKILKNANEIWRDGPCRECKCTSTSTKNNYQSICTKTECPALESLPDYTDYQLEEQPVPEQCCPDIKRTACKFREKIYKIGEKWKESKDYCAQMECIDVPGKGPTKELRITNCNSDCDLGSKYVPNSEQCCGVCTPYACVVGGALYDVGKKWESNDHCTKYTCQNINGSLQVQSTLVNCPELSDNDLKDFVFETIPIDNECCKKHTPKACKVNDKIYDIGESWPDPDGDKCKNFTCIQKDDGNLIKQEFIESCKKECPKGFKYQESNTTCCGTCVQVACILDGELKSLGESWMSADNCTTFSCDLLGDQMAVSSQQPFCPNLDDCPEENIYFDKCCKRCNITSLAQKKCTPENIPLTKTIGLIQFYRQEHGNCLNKIPLKGFTECVGSCSSSTFFNQKSGSHENDCSCCQATQYGSLDVELTCEDGYVWNKTVSIPIACDCEGCAASKKSESYVKSPTKKKFTKSHR